MNQQDVNDAQWIRSLITPLLKILDKYQGHQTYVINQRDFLESETCLTIHDDVWPRRYFSIYVENGTACFSRWDATYVPNKHEDELTVIPNDGVIPEGKYYIVIGRVDLKYRWKAVKFIMLLMLTQLYIVHQELSECSPSDFDTYYEAIPELEAYCNEVVQREIENCTPILGPVTQR